MRRLDLPENIVHQTWYRNGVVIATGFCQLLDPYNPAELKRLRMEAWKTGIVEVLW